MTVPPSVHTRDDRSSTLSIVALALAFLTPIVGVVLGLIARSRSKASGSPTLLATGAVAIGSVLTVAWIAVIALLLSVGAPFAGASPAPTVSPAASPPGGTTAPEQSAGGETLVFAVMAERDVDADLLSAARVALEFFAESASIEVVDIAETDDRSLTVRFDPDVSSVEIDAFTRAVSEPAAEGFYAVDAVLPPTGGGDPGDGSSTPPCDALRFGPLALDGRVLACDEGMVSQLVLPASPRLVGGTIVEVETSGDIVSVALSDGAAEDFAAWTRDASTAPAPGNQIALVDFIGVMTAPTVSGELTGEFQISGAVLDAELLSARLRLLGAGVSFTLK